MSDYEYEQREASEHYAAMQRVEKAPLSERKEACAEFTEAMRNEPTIVMERIGWLLNGDYGYGAMQAAKRVVNASARTNKAAQLTHMIGALEWRCPARMAIAGWKKLSTYEQERLDGYVLEAIRDHKLLERGM